MSDVVRPLAVIETDAFCDGCGFNLHAQRVWRDERLGILVARCPECGRHHAVGVRTSAGTAWLHRLGLVALLLWLAAGLGFVVASFGLCLALQAGASELFLQRRFESRAGEAVQVTWSPTSTGTPEVRWIVRPSLRRVGQAGPREAERVVPEESIVYRVGPSTLLLPLPDAGPAQIRMPEVMLSVASILLAAAAGVMLIGILASTTFWFWRKRWRLAWIAMPALALAAVTMAAIERANFGSNQFARVGRDVRMPSLGVAWIAGLILAVAGVQAALIAFGLRIGRPMSRLAVSSFLPPRARQAFAFLWHVDGKAMPPARPLQLGHEGASDV